jgi:hypothetical protein
MAKPQEIFVLRNSYCIQKTVIANYLLSFAALLEGCFTLALIYINDNSFKSKYSVREADFISGC